MFATSLADLTRYQRRWSRLLGRAPSPPRPRTLLQIVEGFGRNPGDLRMLAYAPPALPAGAPLVVVLHGCKQNAALYDHGTGWSALARRRGFAVLFPEQQQGNNRNLCFNWFQPADVAPQGGELASIDAMIDCMIGRHALDPARVFVTGLSAGGAMAAALLAVRPGRFAAGAVIAGVPFGAARSVGEALNAMFHARRRSGADWAALARQAAGGDGPWPRVAIWQGDADETVVPANALELEKQWTALHGLDGTAPETGIADGHPHRVWRDAAGRAVVESRSIAGLRHGTPIAAPHAGPGGRRVSRMGAASDFILDVGISSTWRIAQSWGLAPARQDAPPPAPRLVRPWASKPPPQRQPARKPKRGGYDPGFGLRLAMAPLASLGRMLRGRKR